MKRCLLGLLLGGMIVAQTAPEVEITAEPHHRLMLANDRVRVFNVEVPAHSETLMHWHRHDYIYVVVGAAEIVNAVEGKDQVRIALGDGEVRFVTGGFAHVFRSVSAQPFRNVTIELLQDNPHRRQTPRRDAARLETEQSEQDRGLEILNGGTSEILFVKDGVQVRELELQPGAAIPLARHGGPHLLVALTNYELRSSGQGESPKTFAMKRGESHWIAAGPHALTISGQLQAKFISLEFR
jgi:quercetin dioxygenase-like cupin family protein